MSSPAPDEDGSSSSSGSSVSCKADGGPSGSGKAKAKGKKKKKKNELKKKKRKKKGKSKVTTMGKGGKAKAKTKGTEATASISASLSSDSLSSSSYTKYAQLTPEDLDLLNLDPQLGDTFEEAAAASALSHDDGNDDGDPLPGASPEERDRQWKRELVESKKLRWRKRDLKHMIKEAKRAGVPREILQAMYVRYLDLQAQIQGRDIRL